MRTSRSVADKIGSSDPNQFRATMKQTYQQLTEKQRYQIQAYYEANNSYRVIADAVGCHKSAISRELLRFPKGAYCTEKAHVDASKKKILASKATRRNDHLLCTIRQLLKRKLSSSAIAGRSNVNMAKHWSVMKLFTSGSIKISEKVATYIVCYCVLNGGV